MRVLKYKNHLGEEIDFLKKPYQWQNDSTFDYEWNYNSTNTSYGETITSFFKDPEKIEGEIAIYGGTKTEYVNALNILHEVLEKDVRAAQMGQLVTDNGQYMRCYLTSSKKTNWNNVNKCAFSTLTFSCPRPVWCKDIFKHYQQVGTPGGEDYLDTPYDIPYDLAPGGYGNIINNDYVSDCDFLMKIYAPVTNPEVYIAGHLYKVHQRLEDKEYILIDSREKTVYLYDEFGNGTNIFNLRDKENNVFQLIPAGRSEIETNTQIDLTVYQERSEPKWIL